MTSHTEHGQQSAQTQKHTSTAISGNGGPHAPIQNIEVEPVQAPIVERAGNDNYPDFVYIKHICQFDRIRPEIDLTPQAFASHRKTEWPDADFGDRHNDLSCIYESVRATGVPNIMGARTLVPSALNIPAWEAHLLGVDDQLLDMIKYGFPMGYIGPVSPTQDIDNHPSAKQFSHHVRDFIQKEIDLGGVVGPFNSPPFSQWSHVSPLMTRPKTNPTARRVITDLTFPHEASVNAYIRKNTVMGVVNAHSLPSIDDVVHKIQEIGNGACMFTIDVARAYKNFRTCPLDWPLLAIRWDSDYFLDFTMPFGARASSAHMQRVADAIVRMLALKGITSYMYLDDIIAVCKDKATAVSQYAEARRLLHDLGLPEAVDKAQPPASRVKWLGINIDAAAGTLSVPDDKLEQVIEYAERFISKRSISRRDLQSVLGRLLYIAKCIRPARLFVSRLLEKLRGSRRPHINIDASMRADLEWFKEFAQAWNGIAVFPDSTPSKVILVDACLTGIGAATTRSAYAHQVAPIQNPLENITELEAINVAVALQTFIAESDRGKRITIYCDNMPAVLVLQSGKGKNKVLLEVARAAWMVQALFQVSIEYKHIPGNMNNLADALSRAHTSETQALKAHHIMVERQLTRIHPCTHTLDIMLGLISHRSPHDGAGRGRPATTGSGARPRNQRKQEIGRQSIPPVLLRPRMAPYSNTTIPAVHLHRIPEHDGLGTAYDTKSCGPPEGLPHPCGSTTGREPLSCGARDRCYTQEEGLHQEGSTSYPTGGDRESYPKCNPDPRQTVRHSSNPIHVLWRPPPVRGSATHTKGIRPAETPHTWGRDHDRRLSHHQNKGRKEHAAVRPEGYGTVIQVRQPPDLPSADHQKVTPTESHCKRDSTYVHIFGDNSSNPCIIHQEPMEDRARRIRGIPNQVHSAFLA